MSRMDNAFKTSEKLERDGIVRDFGFCRITLARAGGANQKFIGIMERISRQYDKIIRAKMLSDEKSMQLLHEAYADAIVLNWETNISDTLEDKPENWKVGIEFDDTELAPFTRENVIQAFKRWPELFIDLKTTAEDMQFYRSALIDGTAKN